MLIPAEAFHQATLAISARKDLDDVLHNIVSAAGKLLGAEYAALGLPNEHGLLEAFIHSGIPNETVNMMAHLPEGRGLLGAIITEKRPIRVPKISDDARSVGFPTHHPPMDSFLGVPVEGDGEVFGNLYFCNKFDADEFSKEDEVLAEMFAAHASIAIQNARLDNEVQRLAVLEERTRLGMDLHDGIIQSIYAVGLTLESARLAAAEGADDLEPLLESAVIGLNDAIRDIRNFILDLRPHRYEGDLIGGINRLAREFQANTMSAIEVILPDQPLTNLPPRIGQTIFLSTQNSLANVARHAKASEVKVLVERSLTDISIEIRDNGVGFDTQRRKDATGHGLHNMRTRAEKLNGTFQLTSAPGEGTRVKITLPLTD